MTGCGNQRPACNADAKTLYVVAATKYAEVLMRSAGCNNFPRCPMGMGTLDDVWRVNRSAADKPVAEAMAAVHTAGGLSEKDFRGDGGRAARVIAASTSPQGPRPSARRPVRETGPGASASAADIASLARRPASRLCWLTE